MAKTKTQTSTGAATGTDRDWHSLASEFVGKYSMYLLVGALAIVLLAMFWQGYRRKGHTERVASWRELGKLPQPPGFYMDEQQRLEHTGKVAQRCRLILETHWETDATPWVLLKMATAQRESGDRTGAILIYGRLWREYGAHAATTMSASAYAGTLADEGRFAAAAETYEKLAAREGDTSRSWLAAGRCREMAGDRQAAVTAYQKLAGKTDDDDPLGPPAKAAWRLGILRSDGPLLAAVPEPPLPGTDTDILSSLPFIDADTEITTTPPGEGESEDRSVTPQEHGAAGEPEGEAAP